MLWSFVVLCPCMQPVAARHVRHCKQLVHCNCTHTHSSGTGCVCASSKWFSCLRLLHLQGKDTVKHLDRSKHMSADDAVDTLVDLFILAGAEALVMSHSGYSHSARSIGGIENAVELKNCGHQTEADHVAVPRAARLRRRHVSASIGRRRGKQNSTWP